MHEKVLKYYTQILPQHLLHTWTKYSNTKAKGHFNMYYYTRLRYQNKLQYITQDIYKAKNGHQLLIKLFNKKQL